MRPAGGFFCSLLGGLFGLRGGLSPPGTLSLPPFSLPSIYPGPAPKGKEKEGRPLLSDSDGLCFAKSKGQSE